MRRGLKWFLIVTGGLVLAIVAVAAWYLGQVGPVGSGFVAKYLCSSTFVSKRNPKTVFQQDVAPVNPLAAYFTFAIDKQKKRVTAKLLGLFERTAVWREECGCTLAVGATEAQIRSQRPVAPDFVRKRPLHRLNRPWPRGNAGPVKPETLGIDPLKLNRALDQAFAEPGPGGRRRTRAVVVVYKGRLVAERYADGIDREMPLLGWSMSKSVTNAMVGILVKEGKLTIQQPAPVPEWRGTPRKAGITIDQLLRMTSGLAFDEIYQPMADTPQMLYASRDVAAFAAAKPLEAEPDSKWHYSSGTSNILARIVRRSVEKTYPHYYEFFYHKLFDRIGMHSMVMEPDASGTFVGSSYAFATALDWARFGLLYLQDGVWENQRILPPGWVAYSATPTAAAPIGQYGAHFWLNAGATGNPAIRKWPHAPRDAFAALGYQEQQVIVIPSRKTVLVRFGATTDRKAWDTDSFIQSILMALPDNPTVA
jgi:CubicO group peptidase (beta-lactamase class C family)